MGNCGTTEAPQVPVDGPVHAEEAAPVPVKREVSPTERQAVTKEAAPVIAPPAGGSGAAPSVTVCPPQAPAQKKPTVVNMQDGLASVAHRAGWDAPDRLTQQARKAKVSRRRKGAPAKVAGRQLPADFEVDESDDDVPRRRNISAEDEAPEEVDEIGDDAMEFLAEVTQYAAIDTKVDTEQAEFAGLSAHDYEQARVRAEQEIMEQHARSDYRERQAREAADAAFGDCA
eukprot:TRINITY_DN60711_c0_g1_i1.p1 TRINITY_DN60711_c0_g1~~TRINITY_DN60711_c0_g1_i1.p1  ORF type:complete len:255 (+),score=97.00 TRINITY_DN60711_c0_g1_i1:80-766(+)